MTDQLTGELAALAGAAGDLYPAFFAAARQFREAADDHFASAGGGDWQAWSDGYAARTDSDRLLVRDGELLASLTDPGHSQHVRRIDDTSLEVGTTRPTANLHRNAGRGRMPRRDVMPDGSLFDDRWITTMRAHLGVGALELGL